MISSVIALSILVAGNNAASQQEPRPKDVILVLAQSEDGIDFSDLDSTSISLDKVMQKGVQCNEFEGKHFRILISERVAPIQSYENASKLTAELQRDTSSTFSYGSDIGKHFRDVFETISPRLESEATADEKCFGLALHLSINTSDGKLKTPISTPMGIKLSDVARPLLKKAPPEEQVSYAKATRRTFVHQLGEFSKFNHVVKPLSTEKLSQEDAVNATVDVSEALDKASEAVLKSFLQYKQNHDTVLQRLSSQFALELSKLPKEGSKMDDLPPMAQNLIREQLLNYHDAFGLSSREEAEAYLETNPTFKINFNVSLYEGYSVMNPRTGHPNRQGIFVVLGNPGNPDKPN